MAAPGSWGGVPPPSPTPSGTTPAPGPDRRGRGRGPLVVVATVVVSAVVVVVLATVGVEGGGDGARPAQGDRGSSAATSPATERPGPRSRPVTEDALATLNVGPNDIGSNWLPGPAGPTGSSGGLCQPTSADGLQVSHVVSYSLRPNSRTRTVQGLLVSLATVFVDDGAALRQEGVDAGAAHGACLRALSDEMWTTAGSGTAGAGTIEALDQGVTQPAIGWRFHTTFGAPGSPRTDGFVDYVTVRRGRVRLALALLSAGSPFDPALKELLIDRVAERIGQAITAED